MIGSYHWQALCPWRIRLEAAPAGPAGDSHSGEHMVMQLHSTEGVRSEDLEGVHRLLLVFMMIRCQWGLGGLPAQRVRACGAGRGSCAHVLHWRRHWGSEDSELLSSSRLLTPLLTGEGEGGDSELLTAPHSAPYCQLLERGRLTTRSSSPFLRVFTARIRPWPAAVPCGAGLLTAPVPTAPPRRLRVEGPGLLTAAVPPREAPHCRQRTGLCPPSLCGHDPFYAIAVYKSACRCY
jgi:hypothetical protein